MLRESRNDLPELSEVILFKAFQSQVNTAELFLRIPHCLHAMH